MEVSGQLHGPVALPPVPTGWEAEWAPEPGLDAVKKRKILHCGNRTRTVQLVAIPTDPSQLSEIKLSLCLIS
jgi:hypothetical protein